jgi:hypothetical protein
LSRLVDPFRHFDAHRENRNEDHLKLVHEPSQSYDFTTFPSSLSSTPHSASSPLINPSPEIQSPLAYHLWESTSWTPYLQYYTPENTASPALIFAMERQDARQAQIEQSTGVEGVSWTVGERYHDEQNDNSEDQETDHRSSFAKLIARYVDETLIREWREAKAKGLKV